MTYANEGEEFINLDMDEAYAPELSPFHVEKFLGALLPLRLFYGFLRLNHPSKIAED